MRWRSIRACVCGRRAKKMLFVCRYTRTVEQQWNPTPSPWLKVGHWSLTSWCPCRGSTCSNGKAAGMSTLRQKGGERERKKDSGSSKLEKKRISSYRNDYQRCYCCCLPVKRKFSVMMEEVEEVSLSAEFNELLKSKGGRKKKKRLKEN